MSRQTPDIPRECKDCAHYLPAWRTSEITEGKWAVDCCQNPRVINRPMPATAVSVCRDPVGRCGPDGKYWGVR